MYKQDHSIVSHKHIPTFFLSTIFECMEYVLSQSIVIHVTTSWYQLKNDYEDGGMCKHVKCVCNKGYKLKWNCSQCCEKYPMCGASQKDILIFYYLLVVN